MMTTKFYIFSRFVHRFLVLVITVSTLIMATTGMMLKFTGIADFFGLDLGLIRYLHNNLSVAFSIVLTLMMITGIVMYLYPLSKKKL